MTLWSTHTFEPSEDNPLECKHCGRREEVHKPKARVSESD